MEMLLSISMPTHRWLGPARTLPTEWFDGDRLTMVVQPFGNFAIQRAAFVRQRALRSVQNGHMHVLGYEPAVKIKQRCLEAIDHSFEINRLWHRYHRTMQHVSSRHAKS